MDIKQKAWYWLARTRVLNSFTMSHERMDSFARMLKKWKPDFIMGYASSLYLFSQFLKNCTAKPNLKLHPLVVRSSAEVLHDFQRESVEEIFGAPLCNFYGSRESSCLASECPEHKGLHVVSTTHIIEIVDEHGRQLPPGETGLVAVTDLVNKAMPFIRYLNGDVASFSREKCTCGRSFPLLTNIRGRISDFIRGKQGKFIHGEFFTHLFYGRNDVKEFQVIQQKDGSLEISVVPAIPAQNLVFLDVEQKIREVMSDGSPIRFFIKNQIPSSPSGKHRFTISNMSG
jgi:phenylacetate-CoA ligase